MAPLDELAAGEVRTRWPRVPLGELLITAASGFACSKTKLVSDGLLHLRPFNISTSGDLNLSQGYRVPLAEAPTDKRRLEAGDVLFNNTNSEELVGKTTVLDAPMDAGFSNHLTRLRFDPRRAEPRFVAAVLATEWRRGTFRRLATRWVGQAAVKTPMLRELRIPLPPLPEQRRIADALAQAESICRLRRKALGTARAVVPALFQCMFGNPLANPHAWPQTPLSAVADIGSGITKGRRLDGAGLIEVPYLRVANVQDGHLRLDEVKTITIRTDERERYRLLPGDLLMTEGGDPDKLGRGALWAGVLPYCAHQNHIFRVRADRARVEPRFLAELTGSPYGKAYFLRVAKQTTGIASINKTQLSAFPVLLPPLERQQAFARVVEEMQVKIAEREAALRDADRLVAVLAQCLL